MKENTWVEKVSDIYSDFLKIFVNIGLLFLLVSFAFYAAGYPAPLHSPVEVSNSWTTVSHASDTKNITFYGIQALTSLPASDALAYSALLFLAIVTPIGFFLLFFFFFKEKKRALLFIAFAEIVILGCVTLGIIGGGH